MGFVSVRPSVRLPPLAFSNRAGERAFRRQVASNKKKEQDLVERVFIAPDMVDLCNCGFNFCSGFCSLPCKMICTNDLCGRFSGQIILHGEVAIPSLVPSVQWWTVSRMYTFYESGHGITHALCGRCNQLILGDLARGVEG